MEILLFIVGVLVGVWIASLFWRSELKFVYHLYRIKLEDDNNQNSKFNSADWNKN